MMDTSCLTNHFLIAMPTLADPNFFHGVTLICEHNENGALGILINRPLDIDLGEILSQMDISCPDQSVNQQNIYLGGPLQNERGFIIHRPHGAWEQMLRVNDTIGLTSSRDMLAAIATGTGPEQALIALGYAGWGPGQLEDELAANAWISTPVEERIIFDVPNEERWQAAASSAGIDLARLSSDVGHA